jgi:sulfonate transport system permease protein
MRLGRIVAVGAGLIVPAIAMGGWALLAARGVLPRQILPPPAEVWETLSVMGASGELAGHVAISLKRVLYGFIAGASLGIILGSAMGLSRRFEEYVKPLFVALAQVPAIGLIPLVMMLVGIDEGLKVIVIARAALIPAALNALTGVREIPQRYFEVAEVFRLTRTQVLWRLALPAALPPIFSGIRNGLTQAWLALVAVELLGASEGLGFLLVWGRQLFQLDLVLVAMALIALIGWTLDLLLGAAEARLQVWRAA